MAECPLCGSPVVEGLLCADCASAVADDVGAIGHGDSDDVVRHDDPDGTRELLRTSIDYLQRRLDFVNNKANVFIAIQTGLFVTIVWLLGTFFLSGPRESPVETAGVLLFLLANFAFVVAVVALLLQTVRPSASYLSLFTDIDTVDTAGVMWPGGEVPPPETFADRVDSLTDRDVDRELVGTVYALQQLVDRTYTYYRWAVLLMKVQILVVPLGFLALAVLRFL